MPCCCCCEPPRRVGRSLNVGLRTVAPNPRRRRLRARGGLGLCGAVVGKKGVGVAEVGVGVGVGEATSHLHRFELPAGSAVGPDRPPEPEERWCRVHSSGLVLFGVAAFTSELYLGFFGQEVCACVGCGAGPCHRATPRRLYGEKRLVREPRSISHAGVSVVP